MIGRASIGNPWIFRQIKHYLKTRKNLEEPDLDEKIRVAKNHLDFSVRWKGDWRGIVEMRRHYTNYFRGIPHFKPFRNRLVEAENQIEINAILEEISVVFAETQPQLA